MHSSSNAEKIIRTKKSRPDNSKPKGKRDYTSERKIKESMYVFSS